MIEESLIKKALARALARGGDFAELYIERRTNRAMNIDDGQVERIIGGVQVGVGIRVVKGDTVAYAFSEDLSEAVVLEVAGLVAAEGALAGAGARVADLLPRPRSATREVAEPPVAVSTARAVEYVTRADAAARAVDPRVVQVTPLLTDTTQEVLVANSEGLLARDTRYRVRLRVEVLVRGRDGRTALGVEICGGAAGYEILAGDVPEFLGRSAARQALNILEARPAPVGTMPVILHRGSGGVLAHEACGHGLEADITFGLSSVYQGLVGQQVASPLVTLVDDASLEGAWGSYGVDDEGTPAQRTILIEEGRLVGFLTDLRWARLSRRAPTGNGRRASFRHMPIPRMSNTFILPGSCTPEDILAETRFGLYARRIGGGAVDPVTGQFVFTVREGYLVRNGRIEYPVHGATLVGNAIDALKSIDMVANDLEIVLGSCGKDGQRAWVTVGQPTMRVSRLMVGGTARSARG